MSVGLSCSIYLASDVYFSAPIQDRRVIGFKIPQMNSGMKGRIRKCRFLHIFIYTDEYDLLF